ncbi:MAG: hypothetical protein QGI68_00795 [Pseudomonadales bacterium]|nr:hypothetical protein [Pseudomonadales bacterium]MDP7594094.1 hypothetical protein [Pseudomonadales bacterium]HJN50515.1 hypothetical protein [Pseudomonadales bacterium]
MITALLPIVAVHISYLLAATWQHVPWCVPYWDSCTSISATGRHSPEYYFFKATMIPTAIMMMVFWRVCYEWLLALGDEKNWQTKTIPVIGFIAALCLILYTTVLGADGDLFRLQRKIGVIIYFAFTALAQLLLTRRVGRIHANSKAIPAEIYMSLYSLSALILAIAILSVFLGVFYSLYDQIEDAFEWVLALLIHCYFLVIYFAFEKTSFSISYTAGSGR